MGNVKDNIKTRFAIISIIILSHVIYFGSFDIPGARAAAASHTFSEDFTSTTYRDSSNTTAEWNIAENKVHVPLRFTVKDVSSSLVNFNRGIIDRESDTQSSTMFYGGLGGNLNRSGSDFSSGIFGYQDLSSQLINFGDENIFASQAINSIEYFYNKETLNASWLVGGGHDLGSGGRSLSLNAFEAPSCSNNVCTYQVRDLSTSLEKLGLNSIGDISCGARADGCLITEVNGYHVAKYDGADFIDITSVFGFGDVFPYINVGKVERGDDHWLISTQAGDIYKYDDTGTVTNLSSSFEFTLEGKIDFQWLGKYWILVDSGSPTKVYQYNKITFVDVSGAVNNFPTSYSNFNPTVGKLGTFAVGEGWLIGSKGFFDSLIAYFGGLYIDVMPSFPMFEVDRWIYGIIDDPVARGYMTGGAVGPKLAKFTFTGFDIWNTYEVYSSKINTVLGITRATLSTSESVPFGSSISYYLSVDGGTTWEQTTKDASHTFTNSGNDLRWKAMLSTTDTKVTPYIDSVDISYETQTVDSPTVDSPIFQVVSPNGGEELVQGSTHIIKWNSSGLDVSSVRISLYQSGVFKEILEAKVPNIESWAWSVPSVTTPSNITTGTKYSIRIFNLAYPDDYGDSNAYFSIVSTVEPGPVPEPIYPPPQPTEEVYPDGTLIKIPDNPNVYVIVNGKRKLIPNPETFVSYNYNWNDVIIAETVTVNIYPEVTLIRAEGDDRIYQIVDGKKHWIPSAETFLNYGFDWSDVVNVNATEINSYLRVRLVRASGDPKIYYITESGMKRHIPSAEVFISYGNRWEDVVTITSSELVTYMDSFLLRAVGGSKVYKLENGFKRWIKTAEAFNRLGYDWSRIASSNSTELNAYSTGTAIE